MSRRDYYDILGVSRSAGPDEVKKSYRQMALKYHPDRNPGDKTAEDNFKEAAEAYSVLGDPEKRATYDRYGRDGLRGQSFSGFDASMFEDFEDILGNFFGFGDLFGGGRARRGRAERGRDLGLEVEISLEEAAEGAEREIALSRSEPCPACAGSRMKPGTRPSSCPACGGHGQVRHSQGFFAVARTCSRCGGSGEIITAPCEECRGTGRASLKRNLKLRIPAGIEDGARLRIAGEGEVGERGSSRGDLYVLVHIAPHEVFERQGHDLTCEIGISVAQAALGVTAEIPRLGGGRETLKIPAGTQPGFVFRMKGCGLRDLDSRRLGDLYVKVQVHTPDDLSKEERALFHRLAELRGETLERLAVTAERKGRTSVH